VDLTLGLWAARIQESLCLRAAGECWIREGEVVKVNILFPWFLPGGAGPGARD
jgi:hypothetical protein